MAKNRTHSDLEHYRGLIRNLKSENRSLKRRLKQLEKREHQFEYIEDVDDDNNDPSLPIAATCPQCSKGFIKETDLGIKTLYKCTAEGCTFRTVKSK